MLLSLALATGASYSKGDDVSTLAMRFGESEQWTMRQWIEWNPALAPDAEQAAADITAALEADPELREWADWPTIMRFGAYLRRKLERAA